MTSAFQAQQVTSIAGDLPWSAKHTDSNGIYPIAIRCREGVDLPDIRINKLKNRLYIFLHGWIPTELPGFVLKLESACLALIPGFSCLAVIPSSGLDHRCNRDFFSNTMDLISAYGAKKVVCVNAAAEQFSERLTSIPMPFQSRIPVKQAADLKEAEDLLNG
jgi:hypothetical protein